MKKTLSVLVMAAIMLSVFFCIPINAATNMQFQNAVTNQIENGTGTRITVYAVDLFPSTANQTTVGTNGEYLVEKTILVSIKISNLTDETRRFYNLYPRIRFSNGVTTLNNYFYLNGVTDIQNQSSDFLITFNDADSYLEMIPSAYFSANGFICVPPHTVLQGLATIKFNVILNHQSAQNPQYWYSENSLDSIDFYNNTYSSPVTTDVPLSSHQDTNDILQDILEALQGDSSTNSDVSNDSGTLATQSDQVHSQEASYYQQNSAAIQATGLSNYQFDASAVSGLTGVRGDFIDVWNSLSGWNSVYIFSLTLGLALTILRHSPSAISSALNRKKYSNQGGKTS